MKNVARNQSVALRAGESTYHGLARIVAPDEPIDGRSREIVAAKYGERSSECELTSWARTSLPVVIELDGRDGGHE